ncbi:unnamed protein product [Prunus brigantina]
MYIKIKVGHYNETIFIRVKKTNITIKGDGRENMIILGNKSNVGCFHTFEITTFVIDCVGFVAQNMTIQMGQTLGKLLHCEASLILVSSTYVKSSVIKRYYSQTKAINSIESMIYMVQLILCFVMRIFQNCNLYGQRPLKG